MAADEMREISTPLESDTGSDAPDTGRDDGGEGDGGSSDVDASPAPQQQRQPRGQDGKFGKQPRSERRADFQANRRAAEELGTVKGQLTALQQQYQRDMAEIRRQFTESRQPANPATPAASPVDEKIATLKQAIASEVAAARAHDPAKGAYDLTRYETLREQLDEARLEAKLPAILKARGIDLDRRPDPNQRPIDQRAAAQTAADVWRRETMLSEAPWLAEAVAKAKTDQRQAQILRAFTARAEYLVNGLGRPEGINTDREAAAWIEKEFKIPVRRAPAPPPRMPVGDQFRGGGDEGPPTLEVPSAQLENVPAHIQQRVAQRMRGR